jgi:ribonuclease T2
MARFAVVCVVFAATLVAAMPVLDKDACNGNDYGTAGQFDYYVFEQQWTATYCSGQSYPLCSSPTAYMQTHLTIHGIWPNYNSEQSGHWWPQCCQPQTPLNQTALNLLGDELHMYWPDCQSAPGYNTSSFWAHEWGKHGTCSGLDQYTYFSGGLSVEVALDTPSVIQQNVGGTVGLSALYAAYAASSCDPSGGDCEVAFSCDNNNNLAGVATCFTPDLQQIVCPAETVGQQTCSDPVNIPSFQQQAAFVPSPQASIIIKEETSTVAHRRRTATA